MASPILARLARQWESPPTWLLLFAVLVWLQARFMGAFPTGATLHVLAYGLIIAGLILFALAGLEFNRGKTTILPRELPTHLLDTGVFALSRNPIYLADALILAGWSLLHDWLSLVLVPVFMSVITIRFIRGEERGLQATFGPVYEAYAQRVRRWL